MEKATIAEALQRISDELSQTLDEVEQGICEFGDIDSYEADREQVEWLE